VPGEGLNAGNNACSSFQEYITRINKDLSVEDNPVEFGTRRLYVSEAGHWYSLVAPLSGDLELWQLDSGAGFAPIKKFLLPGTKRLKLYAMYTLHPERNGGEDDGDTVHLLSTDRDNFEDPEGAVKYWHVYFDLPE
jgi:hypothetical protein